MAAADDLAALIVSKKVAAIPSITDQAQVQAAALPLAQAIIEFFTARCKATILANSISTAGSASAQQGPTPSSVTINISFT